MVELFTSLAILLGKLVDNALSDNYDKEAELQYLLDIQHAIALARWQTAMAKHKP